MRPSGPAGDGPLAELVTLLKGKVKESGNPAYAREYRLALAAQAQQQASRPAEVNPVDGPEWVEFREALHDWLEAEDPTDELTGRFRRFLRDRELLQSMPDDQRAEVKAAIVRAGERLEP